MDTPQGTTLPDAAAAQGISLTGERAGQPTLRLVVSQNPRAHAPTARDDGEPVAEVRGINVHAKRVVNNHNRAQIERLCRYITRPPLAQDRLKLRSDGRLELTLKNIWRDPLLNTALFYRIVVRAIFFEPHDLLARLVAAVHLRNFIYSGVFGCSRVTPRSEAKLSRVPRTILSRAGRLPPQAISSSCCTTTTAALLGSDGLGC